jgi:hypothetical protein
MDLARRPVVKNRALEYFVVCAVVVLISVVSFVSLRAVLAEMRDTRRTADIATLRLALELYYVDHGAYPHTGWVNSGTESWDTLSRALKPHLPEIPRDPINDLSGRVEQSGDFNYSYYSTENKSLMGDKDDYVLVFRLERPKRASFHQEEDVVLLTADGTFTFTERTAANGIFAVTAP